jgi:hypothetical protein
MKEETPKPPPRPKRKTQRPVLPDRCGREEHYELLLAAGY